MSRLSSTLLLLLGLEGPVAAQAPAAFAWIQPSGDYTVFGHTEYITNTVVDSVRAAAKTSAGLAAGLSSWPAEMYCGGPASAAMQSLDPRSVLRRLQLAAQCGVRLVIVPPRRFLTTTGGPRGVFSVDSAKHLTDRYAAVLPADTIRKYRASIIGLNLGDDYGCLDCWGGKPITRQQIAAWADYTRKKLPGIPLGVRVTPDWVEKDAKLAPLLDYAWAQYHTGKGDPAKYFDTAATVAQRLGIRVVMGVNVENCHGTDDGACNSEELARFGSLAVSHPASCAFISWRYDEDTWQRPGIQEAWSGLLETARGRPARECRRVGSA